MKTKVPFEQLKLHSPYRPVRKSREGVVGFDTESLVTGYAFLVTDSLDNYTWIRGIDDLLRFLTKPLYRKSFNTYWNLDFDVTVMLKWLGKEKVKSLVENGYVHYGQYFIMYVPKRFLTIRVSNTHFTFFDAAQYFTPRALDAASKKYLGDAKLVIGDKRFTEVDYGSQKILEYCKVDSKLCARLTVVLLNDLRKMGFEPSTLSSPATIMEEAITSSVRIPDVTDIPSGALEYAYRSYHGGWMECFKRGYFKKVWDYDISSAYPFQVSQLIDLAGGKWTHSVSRPHIIPYGAVYGFLQCTVTVNSDVSPVIFEGDVNYTPRGTWRAFLPIDEVGFIVQHRLGKVEVVDGWYFVPRRSAAASFRYPMRSLFRYKDKIRNNWLPKALSVALYGKFAQKFEDGNTGNLFNPVYASVVTSQTRLAIAEYALKNPKSLVMISADGLTLSSPLPIGSLSKSFGGLRLVGSNEAVVIGTNVMTLKGRYQSGVWRPGRFDWFKLLGDSTVYPLEHFRYTTMAEGVIPDFKRWDDVGCFSAFPYNFDVNFDHKRLFKKVEKGSDLLSSQYDSAAWEVSIPQKRKDMLWQLG